MTRRLRHSLKLRAYLLTLPVAALLLVLLGVTVRSQRQLARDIEALSVAGHQLLPPQHFAAAVHRDVQAAAAAVTAPAGGDRGVSLPSSFASDALAHWSELALGDSAEARVVREFALLHDRLRQRLVAVLHEARAGRPDRALTALHGAEKFLDDSVWPTIDGQVRLRQQRLRDVLHEVTASADPVTGTVVPSLRRDVRRLPGHVARYNASAAFARLSDNTLMLASEMTEEPSDSELTNFLVARQGAADALGAWRASVEAAGDAQRTRAVAELAARYAAADRLLTDSVYALARSGESARASRLFLERVRPLVATTVHPALLALADEEERAFRGVLAGLAATAWRVQVGSTFLAVLVLVVAIGSPWLLARSVVVPIQELQKVAHDAMQALMFAVRSTPDVIVLDVQMPGGTGVQALKKLMGSVKTSQVPVLVLSGSVDPEEAPQLMALGAREFLSKPVDPDTLHEVLTRLVGG